MTAEERLKELRNTGNTAFTRSQAQKEAEWIDLIANLVIERLKGEK
ncbi:hypothetical protein LCGC14_2412770 [marine sediment metagenome]|uniref:Uncharacterized protein n=1 Tax=marine sediment metagenome TaxID=412755 RepID=A0A0F9BS39_9ZZZZ